MKRDIFEFVSKCLICQQVKAEHQLPLGLLQPVTMPEWKWERITMDFISRLPLSPKKKDAIWVIVDRLTKSAHFIPVHMDFSLDGLVELYVSKIVRLHRAPISIIPGRDPRFTSRFWSKLQKALDGQSEHVIQILEDMLRCCILEFEGNWENIKMALYEALYGRKCRTPLYWTKLSEKKLYGVDLVRENEEKVKVGDKVFLKVSPWKKVLRFGRKGKLSPRFIRPYEITERI
ncbi:reverse transcriptase [Gossypium australe]|uniref:Reverse transcriptase n=1 Tax=Gossypium australe TaxID=47621 RepID=A0A5B6X3L8_9ROSI|nr:reverse transcriptase [Gossypium australe]